MGLIFLFRKVAMLAIGLMAVSSTLTGCATGALHRKSAIINHGDSKEQLTAKVGLPENRQMQGKEEAWQYCETGMNGDDYLLVWLHDGLVTGVNTYQNTTGMGLCSSFFRTIRWEDAPSLTIETRAR